MRKKSIVSPWWVIFIIFIVLSWKISQYHLNPDYRVLAQAQRQYWNRIPINADRGTIQDREGNILALSVPVSSYYIDSEYWNPNDAKELNGIFPASVIDKISKQKEGRFLWVARKVPPNTTEKLANKDIKGFFELKERLRFYPNNSLMAQALGFCDIDDRGQSGIELAWDTTLFEPAGYRFTAKKNLGRLDSSLHIKNGIPSVVLTLDAKIQFIIEKTLAEAITANAAKWGAAVCMDPNSGEVLAMASWPTFNPNERSGLKNIDATINNVISRAYEPGSTLKPIIMGVAIEKGYVRTNEVFKCPASFKVADGAISEAYKGTSFGSLSASEILIKSSNVGMAQIGIRVNPVEMYQSLIDYGFGRIPGIELNGVERGLISRPSEWKGVVPANVAIGQGFAVTPLQLVTALSAVVNGGHLLRPYLVKSASDSDGNVTYRGEKMVLRDVVSSATSAWLRGVMHETTINGTGKLANSKLVKIGTKTGTAQVAEKGKYVTDKYVASIAGFWPLDNPQYVVLIVIGEPSKGKYYGGEIAAPQLKKIAEEMLELAPVVGIGTNL
jgi:cell division protein FtsI (penicillin-binding protein 3)/stage V sporulation protein D (sporulation-specific penicillin-binding protein)